MLINSPMQASPETQARQALARVYALLITLAESEPQESFVLVQNVARPESQPQAVADKTNPNGEK